MSRNKSKLNVLIILGGSKSHLDFVLTAKKKCLCAFVFDQNKKAFCSKYADVFIELSIYDTESIIKEIRNFRKQYNLVGIITYSSSTAALKTCALAAKEFNIKSFSVKAVQNTTNKQKMKNILVDSHIPTPKYIMLRNKDEISAMKDYKFKFPVVVKPAVDSVGSAGVYFFGKSKDMAEYMRKYKFKKPLIIEEYIRGKQLNISGYVDDGEVFIVDIIDKFNLGRKKSFITSGFVAGIRNKTGKKNRDYVRIKRLVAKTVRALGINNYLFSVDLILTKDKVLYVLEAGMLMDAKLDRLFRSLNVDIYDILINIAIGKKNMDTDFNFKEACALHFMFANKKMLLRELALYTRGLNIGKDIICEWNKTSGAIVCSPKSLADVVAWVITKGPSRKKALLAAENEVRKLEAKMNTAGKAS
ncbi:MAG: ATP-grasp domain-containing protein [bacterium]